MNKYINKIFLLTIFLILSCAIVFAEEYNPKGWPTPDIRNAKFYYEKNKDLIKEISGKETLLGVYKASDGTYFNTLSIKDKDGKVRLYGFYVDNDGKPPMEDMILDDNGNGIFERINTIVGSDVKTPKWIIDLYSK